MIYEGIKLALVGMVVVFSFLVFLVILMYVSRVLLKPLTQKEEREAMLKVRKKSVGEQSGAVRGQLAAVIGAAVAAHRMRMRRLRH